MVVILCFHDWGSNLHFAHETAEYQFIKIKWINNQNCHCLDMRNANKFETLLE